MAKRWIHSLWLVAMCVGILSCAGCGTRVSVAEQWQQADTAFASGDYRRAAWIYNRLKKRGEFRDNTALRISLGSTYLKLGWLHHAGGEFSEAIELSSQTNTLAWLGLGSCYAQTNDWENAKLCFLQAYAQDAINPLVHLKLGNAYYCQREYGYAINHYREAAARGEDSADLRATIGKCYELTAQWVKAAAEYERAFKMDPRSGMLAFKLAKLYCDQLGNMAKTKQYYDILKKLSPELARVEAEKFDARLGSAIVINPRYSTGTTTVVVAPTGDIGRLALSSKSPADYYEAKAVVSLTNELPKEALKYYQKALEVDPSRTRYNRDIALLYERYFRDLNLAIKHYDKYLEACKDKNDPQFTDTLLYVTKLREDYSRQDGERMRRQQEEERLRTEAEQRRRTEDVARSNAFAQAAKMPQEYDGLLDAGARCMLPATLDLAKARDCFQKATGINPAYPNAWYNLGLVCVKQTNLTESVQYFKAALDKDQKFAEAYLALGMVYEKLGQIPDAIEKYYQYLELVPDSSYADSIRDWLTRNAGAR